MSLLKWLDDEFHFTVDAASSDDNTFLTHHWTELEDGLAQDWDDEVVFCNPPFGQIPKWAKKAAAAHGTAVLLLPASLDTRWWHETVVLRASEVRFLAGRVHFDLKGEVTPAGLPHGIAIVIWRLGEIGPPKLQWSQTWPGRIPIVGWLQPTTLDLAGTTLPAGRSVD